MQQQTLARDFARRRSPIGPGQYPAPAPTRSSVQNVWMLRRTARELPPVEIEVAGWLRTSAKRALDLIGAIVACLVFFPAILVIVSCLAMEDGPILYRHTRIGRDGRRFQCFKFRTMVPNADLILGELLGQDPALREEWERTQKLTNDPRVSRIGRVLRRTSLDELPQLINVLRGDMSLVGPRPVVESELRKYGRRARAYTSIRPGLTGMWQIHGRSSTSYRRRVALDVHYAKYGTMLLDIYLLVKTVRVVFGDSDAC